MKSKEQIRLGPLESAVMQVVWSRPQVTADEVRTELSASHALKESTVRTILRRLEDKALITHDVEGRTYVYRAAVAPQRVASRHVRGIIERFCRGSVENLLVGMVDDKVITAAELRRLADRISKVEAEKESTRREKK